MLMLISGYLMLAEQQADIASGFSILQLLSFIGNFALIVYYFY